MTIVSQRRSTVPREQGYILLSIVIVLAFLVLSLSIALPKVRQEIQRDKELETVRRGQQYVRAIQLYHRRFRTYPTSIDALIDTNGIRFLRKRYEDPMTGKDDWRPVLLGQNKVPTAMGFFGEPLGIAGVASVGGGSGGNAGNSSPNGPTAQSNASTATDPGSGGQSFGSMPIIGVSPSSSKQSLLVYKTKSHYNEWEFVYDPMIERGLRGQPPSQPPSSPPTNTGSPGMNAGSSPANPAGGGSTP